MAHIRIHHDDLRRLFAGIFAAKGMSAADADAVADVLTWANVRGVDGHGAVRLASYLEFIDRDELDPRAEPHTKMLGPTAFTLDAAHAAGPVAMMKAARHAVETARQLGVCIALVRDTTHTGAIGRYPQWVAEQGCACVMMNGGPPFMAYHGHREPRHQPDRDRGAGSGRCAAAPRHGDERRLQRPPAPGDRRRRNSARGLGARR
jgi:ureidoglycolate dehydrogenase (NAD+)